MGGSFLRYVTTLDIMFLICHITSGEQIFKELYEFISGNLAVYGGHWSSACGDIK